MSGERNSARRAEQTADTFSLDDYKKLLNLLKIKIPNGVLTEETVTRSSQEDIIEDAQCIKENLENRTHHFAYIPRLACGRVKEALELKEEKKFQDITKMIFFRETKPRQSKISAKKWKINIKSGCGFRIRSTYTEGSSGVITRVGQGQWFGSHSVIKANAQECLDFYLDQEKIDKNDVTLNKRKLEFEFLSGKPNFLVEKKTPPEKIIVKCKTFRPLEDNEVEFDSSHEYYLSAQTFLFILNKEEEKKKKKKDRVPVRAVMVIKYKSSRSDLQVFHWGKVTDGTEKIEQLNNCCKSEALPRFLAVLHLVFEKEN